MCSQRGWRRRQWLVDRQHQLPFASLLLLQSGMLVALLGAYAWVVNRKLMGLVLELLASDQLRASEQLYRASQTLLALVALAVVLTALIQIVFGVYTSHKLAGPLLKLRRLLSNLAANRLPAQPVSFRRGDYLDELADSLNRLLDRVRHADSELRTRLPLLEGGLSSLRGTLEQGGLPGSEPEVDKLERELGELARLWRRPLPEARQESSR